MRAQLVTLEGENFSTYNSQAPELMGGIMDWIKSTIAPSIAPIYTPLKGTAHSIMEAGRGIKTGDWGRFMAAPFKGIGHTKMSWYRAEKEQWEWYWRPSKMRQWMSPIGAGMTAAAPFTGPAAPFLLGGGVLLSAGGSLGETLYQNDRRDKADAEETIRLAKAKKTNMMWTVAAVGLLGVGAYMTFK